MRNRHRGEVFIIAAHATNIPAKAKICETRLFDYKSWHWCPQIRQNPWIRHIVHRFEERLTLYPHFYDRIVPGWFDKKLGWRRPHPEHVDRTILISPSPSFVSKLPNGKIPDRTDFVNYTTEERITAWRGCIKACEELADDFSEMLEKDQLAACLQPL